MECRKPAEQDFRGFLHTSEVCGLRHCLFPPSPAVSCHARDAQSKQRERGGFGDLGYRKVSNQYAVVSVGATSTVGRKIQARAQVIFVRHIFVSGDSNNAVSIGRKGVEIAEEFTTDGVGSGRQEEISDRVVLEMTLYHIGTQDGR